MEAKKDFWEIVTGWSKQQGIEKVLESRAEIWMKALAWGELDVLPKALKLASLLGRDEIVAVMLDVLLQYAPNIETTYKGRTALHLAIMKPCRHAVVPLLLMVRPLIW